MIEINRKIDINSEDMGDLYLNLVDKHGEESLFIARCLNCGSIIYSHELSFEYDSSKNITYNGNGNLFTFSKDDQDIVYEDMICRDCGFTLRCNIGYDEDGNLMSNQESYEISIGTE